MKAMQIFYVVSRGINIFVVAGSESGPIKADIEVVCDLQQAEISGQ